MKRKINKELDALRFEFLAAVPEGVPRLALGGQWRIFAPDGHGEWRNRFSVAVDRAIELWRYTMPRDVLAHIDRCKAKSREKR